MGENNKVLPKINRKSAISKLGGIKAREISKRRAVIVAALNKAIEIFTSNDEESFDEVMTKGICTIADAVGLDRVIIYGLLEQENNRCFGQIYRWDKLKGGLTFPDVELKIIPNIPVLKRWISVISKSGCVRIRESDYSEDEAAFLRVYGVKSIILMPIFTRGEVWGAVAFQDQKNDQYFDEGCADLLHSAARLFANAIFRAKMTNSAGKAIEALKRREQMADTLNRVA
ncbi:MAG: GAF domain-containing protein, partial [Spirochaetaceae bacterium]|nr:GAF domain-containing protein [Spirochaetaceae bacterium]